MGRRGRDLCSAILWVSWTRCLTPPAPAEKCPFQGHFQNIQKNILTWHLEQARMCGGRPTVPVLVSLTRHSCLSFHLSKVQPVRLAASWGCRDRLIPQPPSAGLLQRNLSALGSCCHQAASIPPATPTKPQMPNCYLAQRKGLPSSSVTVLPLLVWVFIICLHQGVCQ